MLALCQEVDRGVREKLVEQGQVKWRGEIWRAYIMEGRATAPGETVVIDKVSRLWLFVKSVQEILT